MLKAIDFFCGAGGMTYGFSKAKIKVLAGIDNDIECKKPMKSTIRRLVLYLKILNPLENMNWLKLPALN